MVDTTEAADYREAALAASEPPSRIGSVASSLSSRGDDGETIAGRFLFFYPILPSYT